MDAGEEEMAKHHFTHQLEIARQCLGYLQDEKIGLGRLGLFRENGNLSESKKIISGILPPELAQSPHTVANTLKKIIGGNFLSISPLKKTFLAQSFFGRNRVKENEKEAQEAFIATLKLLCDHGNEQALFIRELLLYCRAVCEANQDKPDTEKVLKYNTFGLGFSNLALSLGLPESASRDPMQSKVQEEKNAQWIAGLLQHEKFLATFQPIRDRVYAVSEGSDRIFNLEKKTVQHAESSALAVISDVVLLAEKNPEKSYRIETQHLQFNQKSLICLIDLYIRDQEKSAPSEDVAHIRKPFPKNVVVVGLEHALTALHEKLSLDSEFKSATREAYREMHAEARLSEDPVLAFETAYETLSELTRGQRQAQQSYTPLYDSQQDVASAHAAAAWPSVAAQHKYRR